MRRPPYPYLSVSFNIDGYDATVQALVDTGFDGYFAVPEALTASLPLPVRFQRVHIASGQVVRAPVYLGTLELLEAPGTFSALIIALGDECLHP